MPLSAVSMSVLLLRAESVPHLGSQPQLDFTPLCRVRGVIEVVELDDQSALKNILLVPRRKPMQEWGVEVAHRKVPETERPQE